MRCKHYLISFLYALGQSTIRVWAFLSRYGKKRLRVAQKLISDTVKSFGLNGCHGLSGEKHTGGE